MARTRPSHCATTWLAILAVALIAAGCARSASDEAAPANQSIFDVAIPGTSGGATSRTQNGAVTKLFDVTGDWTIVSIELAGIVQAEGWTITALNCVGTGNDVIAKKRVADEWLLLESGAGERGAGLIVRRDPAQQPPTPLSVTGRCPPALIDAVR